MFAFFTISLLKVTPQLFSQEKTYQLYILCMTEMNQLVAGAIIAQ